MRVPSPSRDDSGASAVQTAILFPVMLFLVLLVVQAGLYYHASQRADAAASRAAAAAAYRNGTESSGVAAANVFLDSAPLAESGVVVIYDDAEGEVTATVTGTADQIMPGPAWTVTAVATAPLEEFVNEVERGETG